MSEIAKRRDTGLSVFDPKKTLETQAKTDAVIEYARKVQDWQALEAAVEVKLEDVREFVRWWRETVTPNRSPDRKYRTVFSKDEAEELTGISQVQVSRWRKRLEDEEKFRATLYGAAYAKLMSLKTENHLAMGSGENEWYTPPEYVEMARTVMGSIDLDPASCDEANLTVKATRIFTEADDGLSQRWSGNVWLNPPYSRDLMPAFVGKLCDSHVSGDVPQAMLVSHNNTDTAWFQRLAKQSTAICFPAKRIKFYRAEDVAAPVNGQAFFYLGARYKEFTDTFSCLGVV